MNERPKSDKDTVLAERARCTERRNANNGPERPSAASRVVRGRATFLRIRSEFSCFGCSLSSLARGSGRTRPCVGVCPCMAMAGDSDRYSRRHCTLQDGKIQPMIQPGACSWRMGVKRGNSPRAFNWFGLRSSELHLLCHLLPVRDATAHGHGHAHACALWTGVSGRPTRMLQFRFL